MKKIKAQPLHEADYANVEAQLKKLFFDAIFRPVLDLLLPHNAQVKSAIKEFKNAAGTNAVVSALRAGKIQYTDGKFSGDFNSTITKQLKGMGATWNKQTKVFALASDLLPSDVLSMATSYQDAAKKLHEELDKRLEEIWDGLSGFVDENPVDASKAVNNVQAGFDRSVGDALGTETDLDEAGRLKLQQGYADNLKPYIKKFSEEMITELREMVKANAKQGYRFDKLVDRIQNRYEVSQTKATFLARQETALLVSAHRQVRFEDVGVTRYIWRTSGKTTVRPDHKHLDGREFLYSEPPIVDHATGRRGNPGQDFGCQCVDEPVLPTMPTEREHALS